MKIRIVKKKEPSQFNIIYADPPWNFKTYSSKGKGKSPEKYYSCLTLEDLKALPVPSLAATDCALFLWMPSQHLKEALELMETWGFTFKTIAFVWRKKCKASDNDHFGLGYWTRMGSEFVLLGTKGNPQRQSASVRQVVEESVGVHSAKPPIIRDLIVELLGELPRIELFARETCPGWVAVGDEIDGKDIRDALKEI